MRHEVLSVIMIKSIDLLLHSRKSFWRFSNRFKASRLGISDKGEK